MATRYAGRTDSNEPLVYTVDAGSTTVSATITALTSIGGYETIIVHNWGATNIYAKVSYDGTNFTPGNIPPLFTKQGGSTNAVLSVSEAGKLFGPIHTLVVISSGAGSAKATIALK